MYRRFSFGGFLHPFLPDQQYCIIDYETFSCADLKKVGAYEYAAHESTEILCVAWRVGTRETLRTTPIKSWSPYLNENKGTLDEFQAALGDLGSVIVAHNALFEQSITRHVIGLNIPPERWLCTAALVSTLAVPRNLAQASVVLRLPVQKDTIGHKLMLKLCKPRKPTARNNATRHLDPADVARVVEYCEQDIETETLVFLKCPPLTPTERRVWVLDQKINLRGFLVDRPLVTTTLDMIAVESERLTRETEAETMGLITSGNQRDAILAWLKDEGVHLPNLQKGTVEDAISSGLVSGAAKTVLELRQAVSKTSTAKYSAFEQRSRFDGRLRDILVYHTASTGRWGGAGIQPQNFPRGTIKDSIQAADILSTGDLEFVRMIYGEPMAVFSSCLRNMIIAPEGKTLDVADYAAIEARVLFWVAEHDRGLQAFFDDRPMYEEMAADIFSVPHVDLVTKDQRFVGKQSFLGCGYGMGAPKFQATCQNFGQEISDDLAALAVNTYREKHWPVPVLWSNLQRAAIAAVDNVGTTYSINRTSWYVKGSFLWCKLPSGRRLAYAQPSVEWLPPPWGGPPVRSLCHYGINNYSRKWEKQRTYGGKLTENVVQAISRDLMAAAMLRIEDTGIWEIVLSVHDELIAERDTKRASVAEFCDLMAALPPWAKGCPVKVEGWTGTRYRK